jgi:hypothetical protein
MTSDIVIAGLVALAIALIFVLSVVLVRRFPSSGSRLPEERFQAFEGRLVEVEHRLEAVQHDGSKTKHDVNNIKMAMQHLPSVKDVNELKVQVAGMSGKLEGVSASQSAVQASIGRVEDFLLKATANAIVSGKALGGGE